MAGRTPPAANTYDNNMADGTAGMDCESLGLMYEVTNDPDHPERNDHLRRRVHLAAQ